MKINSENMNINLRHVRALHSIMKHGTFSAAAASLGIVPSALSEVVRQLEAQVGAPLFDRSTRPPSITPLGLGFLQDTGTLLADMDRAITKLRKGAGLEYGKLSIGASPSVISDVVAPVLTQFLRENPSIDCVIHDDIAEELAHRVADGALDLAIAGRARHSPDLRQREIMQDPIGLACRSDHPLAAQTLVQLANIPAKQVIGLDVNTGTYLLLKNSGILDDHLLHPKLRAHSTIAQLCMIRAGMGIAFLPRKALLLFRDPALIFREIVDLPLSRALYLLQPAQRAQSHVANLFVARLERELPHIMSKK